MTEIVETDFLDVFRQICHAQEPISMSFLDGNIVGRFADKVDIEILKVESGEEAEDSETVFNQVVELAVGEKDRIAIQNLSNLDGRGRLRKPIIWERFAVS